MASNFLSSWRQALESKGLWPKSATARFTAYIVALDVIFQIVTRVAGVNSGGTKALSGWMAILTFIAAVLLIFLGFRWTRNQLLWRLRNRLIVTYIFIGVIPVVLILTMFVISGYLLGNQLTTLLVHRDLMAEVQNLDTLTSTVAQEIASQLERKSPRSLQLSA